MRVQLPQSESSLKVSRASPTSLAVASSHVCGVIENKTLQNAGPPLPAGRHERLISSARRSRTAPSGAPSAAPCMMSRQSTAERRARSLRARSGAVHRGTRRRHPHGCDKQPVLSPRRACRRSGDQSCTSSAATLRRQVTTIEGLATDGNCTRSVGLPRTSRAPMRFSAGHDHAASTCDRKAAMSTKPPSGTSWKATSAAVRATTTSSLPSAPAPPPWAACARLPNRPESRRQAAKTSQDGRGGHP